MSSAPASEAEVHIGRRVRELRVAAGVRQSELAAAARTCGLPWHQPTISNLEAGHRGLSLGEFAVLLLAMGHALGRPVAASDLLPAAVWTTFEPA